MAVSSTDVLGAMVRFFIFLTDAPSYWFSLNKSCNDEFHLANRFGMNKENFEALLVAGNLAQYRGKSFCILADQWTSFLHGHHLSELSPDPPSFDFERKRIQINSQREHFYVVSIGYKSDRPQLKFEKQLLELKLKPPRMGRSLEMQQQALGRSTDFVIANVHIALHLKEKRDGMVPMSTDKREAEGAPVQAPSSVSPNEIVGTEPSVEQIPAFGYPILRKTCGDAFDPLSLSDEIDKFIESLASEIVRLKDGGSGYFEVTDDAGHRISYR
jgi:hypothetical protein